MGKGEGRCFEPIQICKNQKQRINIWALSLFKPLIILMLILNSLSVCLSEDSAGLYRVVFTEEGKDDALNLYKFVTTKT